ncbi:zinc-binding alcohol dehydrogenase domain-containing protein 2-like protein [Dinothrombium tinctorium]|uniref:Zinc-binding alcohol dehydrogenase domain-containing protein 2-like protein n=1 Tax=Dinothrombium tinctorium TaxID=1965070 RepID=A0A3S3NP55_9ACAR|nr:zinc-binding alcohol dehydrogenase domain-containing protein 2-like protein [Dinothrombium tinctorium]
MSTYRKLQVVENSDDFENAIEIIEAPLRSPEPDEVLIKCIYVVVTECDLMAIKGFSKHASLNSRPTFFEFEIPCNIGFELTDPKKLFVIPELKPDYFWLVKAGLTAAIALEEVGHIKENQNVLITCAAGIVETIAVQWAKLKGCNVIGTCSSVEQSELLETLNCDRIINETIESIEDVLYDEFSEGVDVIWDSIGGDITNMLWHHLTKAGRLITFDGISDQYRRTSLICHDSCAEDQCKMIFSFSLHRHSRKFDRYFEKILSHYNEENLKILIDQGENEEEGEFIGLEGIQRALKVSQFSQLSSVTFLLLAFDN